MTEDRSDNRYCLDMAMRERDGIRTTKGDLGEALEVVCL